MSRNSKVEKGLMYYKSHILKTRNSQKSNKTSGKIPVDSMHA